MGNVMVIPAKPQVGSSTAKQEIKKLRVAAYCRVSTDTEEQATSYEAQKEHYEDYIRRNPDWELAGIYADDGISATSTKFRGEFNKMIEDCMEGKIDMVITKSISRFARNTVDCLNYIRQLKDKNIPVFFEKEALNTMDSRGDIAVTRLIQWNIENPLKSRLFLNGQTERSYFYTILKIQKKQMGA